MRLLKRLLRLIALLLGRKRTEQTKQDRDVADRERSELPEALVGATVFLNEERISTRYPTPLHGRIDTALLSRDDLVVPVDTKTRVYPKAYLADAIQLSTYATILRNTQSRLVSPIGYIRNVHPETKNVTYIPVKLASDDHVVKLANRYRSLKNRGPCELKIRSEECGRCPYRDCSART